VTIGSPLPNYECHIVNPETLFPVDPGEKGELLIGGPGVSRGYRKKPKLTAEKFIFHETFGRCYRSGDLVSRPLGDEGEINFHGRIDTQVNIRGNRIELTGIEHHMSTFENVESCVAGTEMSSDGVEVLVAFVVASTSHDVDMKALRKHLEQKLPGYMVPTGMMCVESLPRNNSGKIDRRRLPKMFEKMPLIDDAQSEEEEVQSREPEIISHSSDDISDKILIQCVASVLQIESTSISLEDSFTELGGHSITAIKLSQILSTEFQIGISTNELYSCANLGEILSLIISRKEGRVVEVGAKVNWNEEIRLPVTIGRGVSFVSNDILLTGVTGFMGAYILKQLLSDTLNNIYCAVRAKGFGDAMSRIESTLSQYGLWKSGFSSRIKPLICDLTKPNFGLVKSEFTDLSNQISQIVHCAASTSGAIPYKTIKKTNVTGVKTVLELASVGLPKSVHFVSTLSVFDNPYHKTLSRVYENDDCPNFPFLEGGYRQSKWVCERMVEEARNRGIPTTVLRMGFVTGDSESGGCNPEDWFHCFIRTCVQLEATPFQGMLPHINPQFTRFNMLPVDYCAKCVSRIVMLQSSLNQNFHIILPSVPTTQVFDLLRQEGYSLKRITEKEWNSKCLSKKNPLQTYMRDTELMREGWTDILVPPDYDQFNFLGACQDIEKPDLRKCILADLKYMTSRGRLLDPK